MYFSLLETFIGVHNVGLLELLEEAGESLTLKRIKEFLIGLRLDETPLLTPKAAYMKKSELIRKRKIALLSTVELMKTLVKDLQDNKKTFNRVLSHLDKMTGDNGLTEMEIDFDYILEEIEEWIEVVKNPDWPEP